MTEIITINTKGLVPNHLNDTNIFCRYATNTIIEVEPKEVHFAGFKLNEKNFQEIRFTNISDEISRFHIIPPVSKYFRLQYNKPERMIPGFYVKCTIIFTPDKARNYNDFIKIHTKDSENNIIIPIYAYPAIKGLDVPRNIMFPITPIGNKCRKNLMLHSDSDTDFEYEIVIVKDHPSISIDPLSGIIPSRSDKSVILQFHPSDYSTCETIINIYVSQYNFKPIVCTITGTSEPGLERKLITEEYESLSIGNADLISISKLEKKRKATKPMGKMESKMESQENDSYKLLKTKSIRKQLKIDFESRLRDNVTNEKQNQLRWQTCRGFQPVTVQEIASVLHNREMELKEHNLRMRMPIELAEGYKHKTIIKTNWLRTIRFDDEDKDFDYAITTPQFVPECWLVRRAVLDRFRAAAWRIIINTRLKIRLKKLKESGGNFLEIDNSHLCPGGDQLTFYRSLNGISCDRLPKTELTSNNNFDMLEYKLMLPLQPQYTYLDLSVPLQMHVLNYERVDTSSLNYQSIKCENKMKTTPTVETTIGTLEDERVNTILYSKKSDIYSYDTKDKTLIAFPHHSSYCDNHSYFPLYYYKNELLEEKDPIEMDWKIPKSTFLISKKLIKSNGNNKLVVKSLESSLIIEKIPKKMTKTDLSQLDFDSSCDGPMINSEMIYEEFPMLNSIKDNLDKKWYK